MVLNSVASSTSASDTPISTGPLAGSFPIVSLRTNKADVIVAVEEEIAEKLDKSGEKWRYNGKYVLSPPPSSRINSCSHTEDRPGMHWCYSSPARTR